MAAATTFLAKPEVAAKLRLSDRSLDRLIKDGEFPPALPNGLWTQQDLDWYVYRLTRFGKGRPVEPEPPEEEKK